MSKHNRFVWGVPFAALLVFFVNSAQGQAPAYHGALLYSIARDTSVPPLYPGQPPQVTTAYLWFDEAMRLYPESVIDNFIKSFAWNDTAKTIVSNLYRVEDDNPLSFYMWSGKAIKPNPYKGDPGHDRVLIENRVIHIGDTGRTYSLLTPDVIADVMVTDTFCTIDSGASIATDAVLVNCTLLDPIKGKRIPACPDLMLSKSKGVRTLGTTHAYPTYADTAAIGTCLQFEYSPEWQRSITDEDRMRTRLIDSTGGWWVKPHHEYIVFLTFFGLGADSTKGYFSVWPGSVEGNSGGMYPVVNGIVQDSFDDFGLGGTNFTVADWKSRLRARINGIINP
ncbi:MAG TPA: hypothetical protein VFD13_02170 [Candidatus Kapabacteria bacterium]|nr:hypothetical protein [Candidatus Kapabacteria bacterium]